LLRETVSLFKERFGVPASHDVLLLTGSGTLANQAALYTFGSGWSVRQPELEFGGRLKRFLQTEGLYKPESSNTAWVLYDTDTSHLNEAPASSHGLQMADCVSAFPYYSPPASADVWTTVSSKQLGALPVLGIVVVSPRAWEHARFLTNSDHYSYLNLLRWRNAQLNDESPYTPAIPLVEDLRDVLASFDAHNFSSMIDSRRRACERALGGAVVGEGPVVTVAPGAISDEVATRLDLYRRRGGGHQVFLWSGTDEQYERMLSEIAR
jgi:hypothetical protein